MRYRYIHPTTHPGLGDHVRVVAGVTPKAKKAEGRVIGTIHGRAPVQLEIDLIEPCRLPNGQTKLIVMASEVSLVNCPHGAEEARGSAC